MVAILLPRHDLAPFPKRVICSRMASIAAVFEASNQRCGLKSSGSGKIVGLRCSVKAWHDTMVCKLYQLVWTLSERKRMGDGESQGMIEVYQA